MNNYTWDDIMLENFIKASNGELEFVSVDGKINDETEDCWFSIKDRYIMTMGNESIDMKKYKKVCYKYAVALQKWILDPKINSRLYMEVNKLFAEKQHLANKMFSEEEMDWDELIARVTNASKMRVSAKDWLAKEFFNLLKVL